MIFPAIINIRLKALGKFIPVHFIERYTIIKLLLDILKLSLLPLLVVSNQKPNNPSILF